MPQTINPQPVAPMYASTTGSAELYGYALWKYSDGGWELAKDCTVEGAVNSGPPTTDGLFPGQIRATPSVAA